MTRSEDRLCMVTTCDRAATTEFRLTLLGNDVHPGASCLAQVCPDHADERALSSALLRGDFDVTRGPEEAPRDSTELS